MKSKTQIKTNKYSDAEYVEITFKWEVGHKIVDRKRKILYKRGRVIGAYDLEDAARILAIWDGICCGATYMALLPRRTV